MCRVIQQPINLQCSNQSRGTTLINSRKNTATCCAHSRMQNA